MESRKLLQPVKLRQTWMRNRIVMAAMETRLSAPDGSVTQAQIDYYQARSRGGAGAVVVENTYIDNRSSRSGIISSGLYNDHLTAGKNLLAQAIKDEGALAILQLSHGGPQANPAANDYPILTPSFYEGLSTEKECKALSIREIEQIEDDFAQAAYRAFLAEFDGVELHAAHGYLLSSFLSPLRNLREDDYGSNVQGRARIVIRILEKARALVGDRFILGVRLNATDGKEGGVQPQLACETAKLLAGYADYLSVSGGLSETCGEVMITPNYVPAPTLAPLIRQVKQNVKNIPVFGVGALDYQSAEQCLQEEDFDVAVFGRAMIADPLWPNKLKEGRPEDIRSCCRGNEGCFSRMLHNLPIRCEINPACGQEAAYKIKKTKAPKNIIVIGGGIAGMECARLGARMGHNVRLFERSGTLGGHICEASEASFKTGTRNVLNWLITQLQKADVDIHFNTEVTPQLLEEYKADVVIAAVGSKYFIPPIPGAQNAMLPDEALLHSERTGQKIVVVGGGMVGAETALHLCNDNQKQITVLEMRSALAPEHDPVARDILTQQLIEKGVTIMLNCRAARIDDDKVWYTDVNGDSMQLECDTVVMATGLQADKEQTKLFEGLSNVRFVGDCERAAKMYQAMHGAWRTMLTLEREDEGWD